MHIYIYIVVCTYFSNICIDKVSRTKGIITALFSDKASTFTLVLYAICALYDSVICKHVHLL